MRKKAVYSLLIALLIMNLCGCGDIRPDSADSGRYSTQTSMTSAEYSVYMNKQITVFANQLTTHLVMIKNSVDGNYENAVTLAEESIRIMEEALNGVIVTMPAKTSESDRETTITAMQTAIDNMKQYKESLEAGKDISDYKTAFENDFNALTGLANLYYQ